MCVWGFSHLCPQMGGMARSQGQAKRKASEKLQRLEVTWKERASAPDDTWNAKKSNGQTLSWTLQSHHGLLSNLSCIQNTSNEVGGWQTGEIVFFNLTHSSILCCFKLSLMGSVVEMENYTMIMWRDGLSTCPQLHNLPAEAPSSASKWGLSMSSCSRLHFIFAVHQHVSEQSWCEK